MTVQGYTLRYTGAGIDLLGRIIIGYIIMIFTLGLYFPWFMTGLLRYVCEHSRVASPADVNVNVEFHGSGAGLFARFIIWYLLTLITFGIYSPWALNGFYRFIVENIRIRPN